MIRAIIYATIAAIVLLSPAKGAWIVFWPVPVAIIEALLRPRLRAFLEELDYLRGDE